MKKRLLIVFSLFVLISNAQSLNKNYTMSITPKEAMTTSELSTAPESSVLKKITYYDGLGRVIQSNAIGQSPSGKDIIQHYAYDQFGRTEKTYLPLPSDQNTGNFINNPIPLIETYYTNKYGDDNPYAQQRFDTSPLSRVLESAAPGNDWKMSSAHTTKFEYGTNTDNEVRRYGIDNLDIPTTYTFDHPVNNKTYTASQAITLTPGAHLTGNVRLKIANNDPLLGYKHYKTNELFKNVVKNENWITTDGLLNTKEVFSDKNGRKISEVSYTKEGGITKKLITRYIYDDIGRLIYIFPPNIGDTEFGSSNANNNFYWHYTQFFDNPNKVGPAGGAIEASITNTSLTINAHAYFYNMPIKIGRIAYIQGNIPDVDLGNVITDIGSSQYTAYLKDGYLCIRSNTNPPPVIKNIDFSFQVPFDREIISNYQEVINNLAFQYKYDEYNRQIAQKTPGKGWEYVVYDQLDRQILVQDANLKKDNQWLFTKFDAYGRPVYTGKYSSSKNRDALQSEIDNFINASSNKANTENRTNTTTSVVGTAINYSNTAFPKTNITELLSVSYYDDYNFTDADKPTTPSTVEGQTVTNRTKGLPTSSWIKTLEENTWSKTYTYYDEKGRSIKTYEKNHLGGYTESDTQIDFSGKVLKTLTTHKKNASSTLLTINDRFEYDQVDYLKAQYQKINNQSEEVLSKFSYDDLGSPEQKSIGGLASSVNTLQNINYTYNIRGWLKEINDVNTIGNDLFAYKLNYNDIIESGDVVPNSSSLYNGNIAQTIWRSKHDNVKQSYIYTYDDLNQLKSASYLSSFNNDLVRESSKKFDLNNITYDKNGNIKNVKRYGASGVGNPVDPNFKAFDILSYDYGSEYSNQLLSITDSGNTSKGFIDGNASGNDYAYDTNGNLIKDLNKGISSIEYNHLDLVEKVTFTNNKNIVFTYDASGRKLSKVFVSNGITNTTEYLGGFQYQQGELQFFPTAEGYVYKDGTNSYKYAYIYSDQLGNNRLSYSDINADGIVNTNEILSNSNYYPMGGILEGEFHNSIASNFNYKFQGKELQLDGDLTLYDFGSRMYDPYVGRWFNADPQNQFYSPYLALGNNPITMVDPNGELAFAVVGIIAATVIGGGYSAISTANNGGNLGASLGSFIQGATVSGFSATVGAASGGAVAATGTPYFGTLAAVTGSVTSTATSNILTGNNITNGLASNAIGSAIGTYVGGGSGAFTGGAVTGGLEKAIDGGNLGEVLGSAGISGALSLILYESMEELAYQRRPQELEFLKRSGYRKFSRAAQRSFARGIESGAYILDNGDVSKIAWGKYNKVTKDHELNLLPRPDNAIGDFHFHPDRRGSLYPSYGYDYNSYKSDNSYVGNWKGELFKITPKLRSQINSLSHDAYSLSFRPQFQVNLLPSQRIPQQIFPTLTNINRGHLHYFNKRF